MFLLNLTPSMLKPITSMILLLPLALAMSGLSGCIIGMPLLLVGPKSRQGPAYHLTQKLRDQSGSVGTVGIVVPPAFRQAPEADQVSLEGHLPSARATRIERLEDRLMNETIEASWRLAAVSLVPLQSSEVEATIQSRKVDWVMELQITLEPAEEVSRRPLEVPLNGWGRCTDTYCEKRKELLGDDLVMLVQISLKNDTANYHVILGCSAPQFAEREEAFWTTMDHCSSGLPGEIVSIAFLDY